VLDEMNTFQSLYSSCPVLPLKKVWITSSSPRKRIRFRKHFQMVLQSRTLVAAGPGSETGRNLHIKVLKIQSQKLFYVSILQLAPCLILLLQTRGHLGFTGRSGLGSDVAGSTRSHSRPGPPPAPPVHFEKALF